MQFLKVPSGKKRGDPLKKGKGTMSNEMNVAQETTQAAETGTVAAAQKGGAKNLRKT